ncbi:MAG: hypothetical protein IPK81_23400 [Rhodospirillales bacterium]|nr:MAG: hypothetical protein IPK81_23400 [Rhodospirillales bacterium]
MDTWSYVQTTARTGGELVYAMSQSQTDVLNDDMPGPWGAAAPAGFCAGLALRWIGLRRAGADYPFDPATGVAQGTFWQATRDQNIMVDTRVTGSNPADVFLPRAEAVLKGYGVVVNRGRYWTSTTGVSAAMLERAVFAGDGLYFVEMRRKGGGHALGLQRAGNEYRLFDSNQGEFVLKGLDAFRRFASWFLKDTGYQGRYTTGTWIVGMR